MKHLILLLTVFLFAGFSKAQNFENLTYGTDNSLEVITWNIEFFPHNGEITVEYLAQIIEALNADIIAFQEVAEVDVFSQMIENNQDYEAFTGTTDDLIKLAFVYKPDVIDVDTVYEIFTGDEYFLPFLRRPLVMECMYQGEKYVIINNHFKAMGDGKLDAENPEDEENRRWEATKLLKEYTDENFSDEHVIIVGDLNDVITDEYADNVFQNILDDPANYAFADYHIAAGSPSEWSYPDFPSHIDHIIISNEVFDAFYAHSSSVNMLKIENHLAGGWDEYQRIISDHRPLAIKLFADETMVFSKDFEDQSLSSGGWSTYNVMGSQAWLVPETKYGHNDSYCCYISGYDNGAQENENWLVSPAFSSDEFDNLRLSFWNTSGFNGPVLQLYWSDNFSGDPEAASWTEIENANWHDGNTNWIWTFSGNLGLSNLSGSSAHIAFKYTSTSQQASTWEVDDILLSDAGNMFDIFASMSLANSGVISGAGTYIYGETIEMTATPEPGFSFVNWTENGNVVSTDTNYTFLASKSRNLTANFSETTRAIDTKDHPLGDVYPNPTNSTLNVRLNSFTKPKTDLKLILINNVGQKISLRATQTENGEILTDIGHLKSGFYFLQIKESNNTIGVFKIVLTDK